MPPEPEPGAPDEERDAPEDRDRHPTEPDPDGPGGHPDPWGDPPVDPAMGEASVPIDDDALAGALVVLQGLLGTGFELHLADGRLVRMTASGMVIVEAE